MSRARPSRNRSEQKRPICSEAQVTSMPFAMSYVGSREDRCFLLGGIEVSDSGSSCLAITVMEGLSRP